MNSKVSEKDLKDIDIGKRMNLAHCCNLDEESVDSIENDLPGEGPKGRWGSMHNPYGKAQKSILKKVRIQEEPRPYKTTVQKRTVPIRNNLLHKEVAHHARGIDSDDSGDGDFGEYTLNDNTLKETNPEKERLSIIQRGLGNYQREYKR